MRFSAATSNAHRIHYDWPYATRVEGYPGLVVHGPLMTLALAEVARLEGIDAIRRIEHRNLAPLFCGETTRVESSPTGTGSGALVLGKGGTPCSTLTYRQHDNEQEK